jgi:hypothetical protein
MIVRPSGRGLSRTNLYFSDIRNVAISPIEKYYRIDLSMKDGSLVPLVARERSEADRLDHIVKQPLNA